MNTSEWLRRLTPMPREWEPTPDAAVLVGSHVRGEVTPWSDIDVVCVGPGPDYVFQLTDDMAAPTV